MATPTASPQVASTVGLKNVVIAPLTEDTDTSHTYGELQLVAGAIEATITPDNTDPDTIQLLWKNNHSLSRRRVLNGSNLVKQRNWDIVLLFEVKART